jgi:hypothetical protein
MLDFFKAKVSLVVPWVWDALYSVSWWQSGGTISNLFFHFFQYDMISEKFYNCMLINMLCAT